MNLVDLVAELFAAYGRDAMEENLRAYVAVLKHGNESAVQRAIMEAVRGGSEKLPTAAQLMKAAREIQKNDRQAVNAGWSLAQRDELMDVCELAFDQKLAVWRWNESKLAQEVAKLAQAVKDFRRLVEQAKQEGKPEPDEVGQRWGWALPKPDRLEWDPAKESLWDHIKKIF